MTSKSTGQSEFDSAVVAITDMLKNGGRKRVAADMVLSDAEFEEIQRRHFNKKASSNIKKQTASLSECLDAISAFKKLSGLERIATATPEDCESFQTEALKLPKNWRKQHPNSKKEVAPLSPSTVRKWLGALQAAYERANSNAGRKCVRGVVAEEKLLKDNPWKKFTWIKGRERELRQFDDTELLLLLDYFETNWPGLDFAPIFAKVLLWSWGRKEEISSLEWSSVRIVGDEYHFDSTGKWAVQKWFRLPRRLFNQLETIRIDSPFVFACYSSALREFYINRGAAKSAALIRDDFAWENLADWFYRRIVDWSASLPNGEANVHVFRKTTLQYARSGEDVNRQVAKDAHISTEVMMTSYATESDAEMRAKSNRIYQRLINSLPVEVAVRYGYEASVSDRIMERLDAARASGDWTEVSRLATELQSLAANGQPSLG